MFVCEIVTGKIGRFLAFGLLLEFFARTVTWRIYSTVEEPLELWPPLLTYTYSEDRWDDLCRLSWGLIAAHSFIYHLKDSALHRYYRWRLELAFYPKEQVGNCFGWSLQKGCERLRSCCDTKEKYKLWCCCKGNSHCSCDAGKFMDDKDLETNSIPRYISSMCVNRWKHPQHTPKASEIQEGVQGGMEHTTQYDSLWMESGSGDWKWHGSGHWSTILSSEKQADDEGGIHDTWPQQRSPRETAPAEGMAPSKHLRMRVGEAMATSGAALAFGMGEYGPTVAANHGEITQILTGLSLGTTKPVVCHARPHEQPSQVPTL
jgi:hypothetical protein